MLLAANELAGRPLTQEEMVAYGTLIGLLLTASAFVYLRMFRRIAIHGPQTRPDLLAAPEMLAGGVLMAMLALNMVTRWFGAVPDGQLPPEAARPLHETLMAGMGYMLLPALLVVVILVTRGGHLSFVYGLNRVGFFRTIGIGFCLAVLAVPVTLLANAATVHFLGGEGAPQVMVQHFKTAVGGRDWKLIGLIAVSACVVAPLTEEILFRGTFYPMLARWFGRGPSAIFTAVLFAAVHDKVAILPGLTLLAIFFTLAYEFTGSLLVPIVMHMVFNGISLAVMWWQVHEGFAP